jgi:hypothetical protein
MRLVPVDGNPFGDEIKGNTRLVPVEGNPFAQAAPEDFMRGPAGVAADMNPLQALVVGAGRGFDQLGLGIRQPLYALGSALGFQDATAKQAELAAQQPEADRVYRPLQQAHPLATGIGETVPAFAVPVGGATSVLGAAGRMALPGLLQGALSYGSPEQRLKDAAIQGAGGALGGGLMALAGKAVSPAVGAATRAASPELGHMAQVAKDAGIQLNPAQAGGGKFAQGVESALHTIPWTAGAQQAAKDAQQAAFNKALLGKAVGGIESALPARWTAWGGRQKAVGIDATKATPDVLAQAADTIGQKFEQGITGVTVPINQTATNMVDAIANKYAVRLDSMQKPIVANIAQDLKEAGRTLTGEQYHSIVSDIALAARNIKDKPTQGALKSLRSVLDSSYRAAAPAEQAATYFEARGQWKNLLTIEEAMKNARSQADIPAKSFYAAMQKNTPNFVRGAGGEVGELARMGRQFLPDPIANSGTPFRNAFTNLLSAGTMGGMGAGGMALTGGDPMEGLKLGLLGYAASKGAQGLYNSRYPMNQLLSDEAKRMLIRGGGLLGTGGAIAVNQ